MQTGIKNNQKKASSRLKNIHENFIACTFKSINCEKLPFFSENDVNHYLSWTKNCQRSE